MGSPTGIPPANASSSRSAQRPSLRARCVWIAPEGISTALPLRVLSSIESRGIKCARAASPYAALAELLRPCPEHPLPILMLVEPERMPFSEALASSLRVYHSGAFVWGLRAQGSPMLSAYRTGRGKADPLSIPEGASSGSQTDQASVPACADDRAAVGESPATTPGLDQPPGSGAEGGPATSSMGEVRLRLASQPGEAPVPPSRSTMFEPLLTQPELDMLLGPTLHLDPEDE